MSRARWFACWYLAIGCGFLLLGIRLLVAGARPWQIGLRFLVAAGFFLLAWVQFRYPGRER